MQILNSAVYLRSIVSCFWVQKFMKGKLELDNKEKKTLSKSYALIISLPCSFSLFLSQSSNIVAHWGHGIFEVAIKFLILLYIPTLQIFWP